MDPDKKLRDELLALAKSKRIFLEGNILKVLKAKSGDTVFEDYLKNCINKDSTSRKKRLTITKQVQQQNKKLAVAAEENERLLKDLQLTLKESEKLKDAAEKGKDKALEDLEVMQKKTQTELIGTIVKVALVVIVSVGVVTTAMYVFALFTDTDTQIIGSTWSNMLGILLTNAFSIVGTIMGVKYATEKDE